MTLKSWYIALDDKVKLVEAYENNIKKYYHNNIRLNSTFRTGFYNKEKYNPIKAIKVVPSLVMTVFAILGVFIAIIVKSNEGDLIEAFLDNWQKALIIGSIVGILVLALIIGASIGLALSSRKKLCKKLDLQEQELYNFIKTIPSNFRSSHKMSMIYQMYCARPDALPEVIFQTCNELCVETPPQISAVMFDIPYKNELLDGIADGGVYSTEEDSYFKEEEKEEQKPCNPYLPADIESKTFEGSSDSEQDLQNMIGLASVKDQIQKMKNRVQFYGQSSNGNHMAFMGGAGVGKAQPLYSKVLTPNGFITMGEVKVGTKVIDGQGNPATVLGVFPQGVRDIYEVVFDDGSTCRCSDEHLWVVQTPHDREKQTYRTVTLSEIRQNLTIGKNNRHKWAVDYVNPIEFSPKDLYIHPYLLGLLIGDGCLQTDRVSISLYDPEIRKNITNFFPNDSYKLKQKSSNPNIHDYYIIDTSDNYISKDRHSHFKSLNYQLDKLGLRGKKSYEKFIPTEYLYADVEQRLWLLRGLLDTDGCVNGNTIEFSTTSKQLMLDIIDLVHSLGGYAKSTERIGKYKQDGITHITRPNYRVTIQFAKEYKNVFYTSNKANKYNPKRSQQVIRRIITDVKYVGKEECQCIYIDNPCHTYITDNYIITHNTTVARIVTKILFDLKIIQKNQYVEISGDYLRSGDTNRASAILDYAMGGVLFIDEAYLLYDKNGRGADATGVLLKAMEDRRSDFVVILAGYEEQMTKLIASNEGFSSRIKHTIYFPDYEVDEMLNIFNYFISNYNGKKYVLMPDAQEELLKTFELEKKSKSFGNARTVRNAVDTVMDNYADRCIATHDNTNSIRLEDVQKYSESRRIALQHELKNAGASNQLDESIVSQSELKSKLKNGSDNPDTEITNMVGAESFKAEMDMLKNQKDFYGKTERQKILLVGDNDPNAYVRVLTGYLYKLGYITENKYLDMQAEFLKGSYVGHTAKRAEAIIAYASGGVLLIRNINMLTTATDSFSSEAISAIMEALNEKDEVTIVVADAPSNFINNIQSNFTITYQMPVYDKNQLIQIFMMQSRADGFSLDQSALDKLNVVITPEMKEQDVIGLYNSAKKNHINNYTEQTKYILTGADIVTKPKIKLNLKLS